MPRILIDAKKLGNNNDVRITETGPHLQFPYVALSYCWGQQGQAVILTKQNKMRLLNGIGLRLLDRSIQDAIKVTRELGFQYLWIDTLCIMQDDDLEKAHDIVHMHNIYRDAAFTIIASRPANVTEGFLQFREPAGAHAPNTLFSLIGEHEANSEANSVIAVLDGDKRHEPWDDRAWTLQGRLSSGRFLMFGNFQTHWSCRRGEHPYEDGDGWLLHQQWDRRVVNYRNEYNLATDIMNQKTTRLGRKLLLHNWYRILVCYAKKEITYPQDRLPAISSIARAFARLLDDEWLAATKQRAKVSATRLGFDAPETTSEECTEVIRELWGGIENVRTVNLI
ncbi:uncharacterized protein PG986_014280 [Apiospora aurea]|uniref:Heterokaryon incompatibility domain-containing protein n=1 Tax=Apiospora aurea TaxID=335848 RepID=A0ABR1PSI8_9PEZI